MCALRRILLYVLFRWKSRNSFLMIGANLGSRSITAVYSNIGIIRLPEEYKEYIQHFGIFASTNSLQMCSCSYGDEMVLGFTSKIPNDSIQRNFQRMLGEENVSHRELKNEFPGYGEKHRLEKKKIRRLSRLLASCVWQLR